jgi:hypothetical protein
MSRTENAVVPASPHAPTSGRRTTDRRSAARPALARRALLAGPAAAVVMIVVTVLDGATRPGYDPMRHWISHLSLGDRGGLGITNLFEKVAGFAGMAWIGTVALLLRNRTHR